MAEYPEELVEAVAQAITRTYLTATGETWERAKERYPDFARHAREDAATVLRAIDASGIIALIRAQPQKVRRQLFDDLSSEFHMHCGSDNPWCPCDNDE